jgi:uncharacterized protein (TIGR03067 family)
MLRSAVIPCLVVALVGSGCASTPSRTDSVGAAHGTGPLAARPGWVRYADWWDEHPVAAVAVLGTTVALVWAGMVAAATRGAECGSMAGLFSPHGRDHDPAGADREALQGSWQVLAARELGQAFADQVQDLTLVVRYDRMTFKDTGWVFTLNPEKKPKWIDLAPDDGPPLRGIYELDGDTLKICLTTQSGGERPTEFVADLDASSQVLLTCTRVKP